MTPTDPPYPPSWVDRLFDRIDALPGAAWVTYLVTMLAVILVTHMAAWADGLLPPGDFDAYLSSIGVYLVLGFAAIAWIDGAATRAWDTFRPAVTMTDAEAERTMYELTTMPSRPTLVWSAFGAVSAILYTVPQYGQPLPQHQTPLSLEATPFTLIASTLFSLIAFVAAGALAYHSIRQLRLVARIHASVQQIDLLALEPLHAFSGVTAMTGVVLVGLVYISAVTDPATFTNPALLILFPIAIVLAIACFLVPLYGMHRRIVDEKGRRLAAANRRLDAAMRDLDRRADAADLTDADAVNKHLASLLAQREVLARTPTWPWAAETLRGFSTAILLPIGLWLVFRVLERTLA